MAKPLIQVALDSLDYEQTLALARQAAPYVDIIEIGTPCLKVNGIAIVKAIRAQHPDKLIFADLKTMDAGYYEAEPFFKAGADITTVLGTADIGTIKGVVDVANAYGKQAQVDLINVTDKAARAAEAAKVGAPAGSVDDAVRRAYESWGYGPGYKLPGLSHRTGHGIGMEGHEPINLVHGETTPLAAGMCFSN